MVFSFVLMLILYVVAVFSTMSFWPKEEVDKDFTTGLLISGGMLAGFLALDKL